MVFDSHVELFVLTEATWPLHVHFYRGIARSVKYATALLIAQAELRPAISNWVNPGLSGVV
ncbi:hypothetical protein TOC8171_10760 [Pseudomonas syringae]